MIQWKAGTKYFFFWINAHRHHYQVHIGFQWRRAKKGSRADFCRAAGITFMVPVWLQSEHYIEGYGWARRSEFDRAAEFIEIKK